MANVDDRRWREVIRPQCRDRDEATRNPDGTTGANCWICNQPIDYTIPTGQPEAWSPDHLRPVKTHPELRLDPANIKPAHLTCNKARGTSTQVTTSLGALAPAWWE